MTELLAPRSLNSAVETAESNLAELDVHVVDSVDVLAGMAEAWDSLLERDPDRSPYLTWEWISTWWKHFGGRGSLNILVLETRGDIVGIIPLWRYTSGVWPFKTQYLANLGAGTSDYGGAITLPGEENRCAEALVRYLREDPSAAGVIVQMSQIPGDGRFYRALRDVSTDRTGLRFAFRSGSACPYLRTDTPWDIYFQSRGKYLKRGIKKGLRKMGGEESVSFTEDYGVDLNSPSYRSLDAFYTARWGDEDAVEKAFFDEIAPLLAKRGWGVLTMVEHDGVPVSVVYSIKYGGRLHDLRRAFDLDYSRHGVGQIHMKYLSQMAFESGLQTYDLGRGEHEYKYAWASAKQSNYSLMIYAQGWATGSKIGLLKSVARFRRTVSRGLSGNIRLLRSRTKQTNAPGTKTKKSVS